MMIHLSQEEGDDDYWDDDFDEKQNCARRGEMEKQRETEPGRCASAGGSGQL